MGVTNFDILEANAFIGGGVQGFGIPAGGKHYFVKPITGNNGHDGLSPATAFQTVAYAYGKCVAGRNDTVHLLAEGNTAAATTDYQTATLTWAKDLTHLVGENSSPLFSNRSRIAFLSTYATASNLFTLSANGCIIAGIEFYAGVASALPTGCFLLSGQRNRIQSCHIAGFGNAAQDIAAGYSLNVAGGAENLIQDCTIGTDTVTLGASINAQIYFTFSAIGATRNWFRGCRVMLYTAHATNTQFLRAAAGSMDRYQVFQDCQFLNAIDSGSTNLTQAATIAASGSPAGGVILLGPSTAVIGATDWNATDAGNVTAMGASPTAGTVGLAVDVTR